MVAKIIEVMTEELIINKLMVDGDNMIRLEGFLMPNSKQQLVRSGDSSSLFTSTVLPWQMTKGLVRNTCNKLNS